jgi:alpha-aminoadipic semialdehyde synthase
VAHQIGIRREDKNQWERRVPLIPEDVSGLISDESLRFVVQPSPIRIFENNEYEEAGAQVSEDLSACPVVLAVKEIPSELLMEGRTYIYFSHTIKGQHYNMDMLRRLMELKCNLIDYERITDEKDRRLIFFGRHAGLAGAMDTFWSLGERLAWEGVDPNPFRSVKMAHRYDSLQAAFEKIRNDAGLAMKRDGLPVTLCPFVVGVTGYGNVSKGAQEVIDLFPNEELAPEELEVFFSRGGFDRHKIYKVVFREEHLVVPGEKDTVFGLQDYYDHPEKYRGDFERYLPFLSVMINCIYWDNPYPRLFTKESARKLFAAEEPPRIRVVGDISCDINGSIEFTKKATEPDNPVYVYDPEGDRILDGVRGKGPVVMAVDNLPCELPREASEDFSRALKPFVAAIAEEDFSRPFDSLQLPDPIKKALILHQGRFAPDYQFMEKFLQET